MTSGPNSWHLLNPDYRNPPSVTRLSPSNLTEEAIWYASNRLWFCRTFPMHVIPATISQVELIGTTLPRKGAELPTWPWRDVHLQAPCGTY